MRGSPFLVLGAVSHISLVPLQARSPPCLETLSSVRGSSSSRKGNGNASNSPRNSKGSSRAGCKSISIDCSAEGPAIVPSLRGGSSAVCCPGDHFRKSRRHRLYPGCGRLGQRLTNQEKTDYQEIHSRDGARDTIGEEYAPILSARRIYGTRIERVLQRLRSILQAVIPFTPFKRRRRRFSTSGQSTWKHGGPVPGRYRPLLEELKTEIASKRGLERRARKVDHELDTIALARYLEAAYWSLEHNGQQLSDLIEESISWRERVGAHRLRGQDVADHGSRGNIIVKGHDLRRRPVIYFRPALCGKLEGDGSERLMIYSLERAIRLMPAGSWQYTIVIDCQGMGLKYLPSPSYMKRIFSMLGVHYPMRLGTVLFTNVGPSMMLCWRVISPLLPKRTKDKMVFVPVMKHATAYQYIHPTELLSFVGGRSTWHFNPKTYFSREGTSL